MKGVIVHIEKCIGCRHCMIACAIEHSQNKNLFSAITETPKPSPRIFVDVVKDKITFPNRCRHCSPAPCMEACPANAIYRDEETGSVLLEPARCINCGMCAMACPFGVIRYKPLPEFPEKNYVAIKCDNCIERTKEGKIPACVEACKTGALEYGEINEILRKKHLIAIRQEKIPLNIELWRNLSPSPIK
ncbi:4Fe-4S ferredoxin [Candidatus Pacearchaeota archaeon]|nr:MAG: 4Fe-4S ferredoxin [Candidatus Pacearchaeota archaeon]